MANRSKTTPDHFQVEGGRRMDRDRYGQEVEELKHEQAPRLQKSIQVGEGIVHAGQTLGKPVLAACKRCDTEIGVPAGGPILPCASCRGTTFRVVKTGERKGEVVHAGQILGRPAMAVCTTCETEIGLKADARLLPCDECRGTAFRVVG